MASKFQRQIAAFTKSLKDAVSPKALDAVTLKLAASALDTIRRRTREGYGVARDGASKQKLKRLSAAYIEHRRRSRLSSFTSPAKSNLTFTNDLLGSMFVRRQGFADYTISFRGRHRSGISNAKLAEYVSEERPFMHLSKDEDRKLSELSRREFDRLVARSVK